MTVSFGCHVATSLCLLQRLPSLPFPVCCNNCEARLSAQRSALTGKSCNCLRVVATYRMSFIRVYLYTNFILLQHLPGLSYTGTFFLVATITKKSCLLVSVATVTKLTSELSAQHSAVATCHTFALLQRLPIQPSRVCCNHYKARFSAQCSAVATVLLQLAVPSFACCSSESLAGSLQVQHSIVASATVSLQPYTLFIYIFVATTWSSEPALPCCNSHKARFSTQRSALGCCTCCNLLWFRHVPSFFMPAVRFSTQRLPVVLYITGTSSQPLLRQVKKDIPTRCSSESSSYKNLGICSFDVFKISCQACQVLCRRTHWLSRYWVATKYRIYIVPVATYRDFGMYPICSCWLFASALSCCTCCCNKFWACLTLLHQSQSSLLSAHHLAVVLVATDRDFGTSPLCSCWLFASALSA